MRVLTPKGYRDATPEELAAPVQTVESLKQELMETDWKIIKCMEYALTGLEAPYDIAALHTDRQAIRDKINEAEGL